MLRNPEFSHFGVFCHDVERMAEFYKRVFGMVETDRGGNGTMLGIFLSREAAEHHQIALVSGRVSRGDEKIIQQISFRLESLEDLRAAQHELAGEPDVKVLSAVNHVMSFSVYALDPEGNRLELFVDAPFYVEQPKFVPLDLTRTDDDILTETAAAYRDDPTFKSFEDWKAGFARKLEATAG